MSGADDLRTAIAGRAWDRIELAHATEKIGSSELSTRMSLDVADAIIDVLADPVRRLAILNLIGDVHKVKMAANGQWWHECVDGETAFVVRPRGEATGQIDSAEAARRGLQRMREREAREARGEATDA